jgi:hypothetical protein
MQGIRYGVLGNQPVARCADANIFTRRDMIPDDHVFGRIRPAIGATDSSQDIFGITVASCCF